MIDDGFARPTSPNLLSSLPGLRRGRNEEPTSVVMQELPASLPMNSAPSNLPAHSDPPTLNPTILPSTDVPPVDDIRPNVDSLPPLEPPLHPPPDHHEPIGSPELNSSPSTAQTMFQITPQDIPTAEPPTEAKQEPERQSTPPPPPREASPVPQKVKTSFKDFLMRKKKEQVESPVIPSLTISTPGPAPALPLVPPRGSDPVENPFGETKESAKEAMEQQDVVFPGQSSGPLAAGPSGADTDTSSPAPEPEPVEDKPEVTPPPQHNPGTPPESWLLDPRILRPGVVVDLQREAQDSVPGEFMGARGVIEPVVDSPERHSTALFKPIDGKAHAVVVPMTTMIPVRPSEEGEVAIVLSGKHKGKVGKVIGLGKDMVSVDLDGPETTVVDLEPPWLCLFSRDRMPLSNPSPSPPRVPPEKGSSISPSPAPQSEDGEIVQEPPPRVQPQQPGNSPFPQVTAPLRAAPINAPTQPRSFQNTWKNNTSTNTLGNAFANSLNRPSPPSGPKALRGLNPRTPFEGSRFKSGVMGSGLNGNGISGLPGINGNGLKRESNPNNGHPAIPKGPSADRERERERTNGNWSTKNWGGGWR